MIRKKVILAAVTSLSLLGAVSTSIAFGHTSSSTANSISYGPNVLAGEKQQSSVEANFKMVEYSVSDEHEIDFVRKHYGDAEANRLLHRYKTPLNVTQAATEMNYTTNAAGLWGGYIATPSSAPKEVDGYFTVPTDTNGLVAPWAGLGGQSGNTQLIQTGVLAGTNPKVITQPMAWTEALPAAPQYWFYVNPGDQMHSSVGYDSDTGKYNLYIADLTSGAYYAIEYSYTPGASAEWVIEPAGTNPLGNFTVNFTNSTWTDSNLNVRAIDYNTSSLVKQTSSTTAGTTNAPSSITDNSYLSSFSISK
jgi:hypothetical protein